MNFCKQTIVIGISGGIAAFKIKELITSFREKGFTVFVIMTKNATRMISPNECKKVSGNDVFIDLFPSNFDYKKVLEKKEVDHIALPDKANIFLIAPATANIIGKIANGIADDFLTTAFLATKAPVLVCPAMNGNMWKNPFVQENIQKLKKQGVQVMEPDSGMLACGYEGEGRLPDIEKMQKEAIQILEKNESLKGKTILVTAGGTIEKIDAVRFITNKSSGKMGVSIAESCYLRGANVLLLQANTSILSRYPIEHYFFETADELTELLKKYAPVSDICFHVAAVSDFIPQVQDGKISSEKEVIITLEKKEKLYIHIKKSNPRIKLIAFKAEWQKTDDSLLKIAKEKLKNSMIDMIIINDIGKPNQGFFSDMNEVIIVEKDSRYKKISLRSKRHIAEEVISYIISETNLVI